MIEYFPPGTINFEGGTVLPKAYDAEITHELNGQFDLVFKYPLTDLKYMGFMKETIFYADVPYLKKQAFYLAGIKKKLDYVEVYAKHIFFLNSKNVTKDIASLTNGDTGQMIMDRFRDSLQIPTNFTFYSNITERHVFNEPGYASAFVSLVDGKHSILGQWGGVLVMDNFEVKLLKRFGRDTEYLIAKRKNINDIEISEDSDDVVTRLFLTTEIEKEVIDEDDETTNEKETINTIVDSPLINEYPKIYGDVRETTDESIKNIDDLIAYGQRIFNKQRIDLPKESFTFDVTDDVKNYEFTIDDTALVYYEDYDLYKRVKVESYRYDPVRDKYLEVKFGDKEKTLSQETNDKIRDEIIDDVTRAYKDDFDYIDAIIKEITKDLGNPEGGIIKLTKDNSGKIIEILIVDNEDLEKAKHIWRLNIQGISHSSNGINGDFDVAMTQDGKIVADFIATGVLNAALIKAGVLQSLTGDTWIDMSNGHFKLGGMEQDEDGFRVEVGGKDVETNLNAAINSASTANRNANTAISDAYDANQKANSAISGLGGKADKANIKAQINMSSDNTLISNNNINLVGAVTVLSDLTSQNSLGNIYAGRLQGPGVDIDLNHGSFSLENNNGQVIIDGSSNMFKIASERTINVSPDKENYTGRWRHNLGYTPAYLAFQLDAPTGSGLTGSIKLPASSYGFSAGNLIESSVLRLSVDDANININYMTSDLDKYGGIKTVKIYLLKERLL